MAMTQADLDRVTAEIQRVCEQMFREGHRAARESNASEDEAWRTVDLRITARQGDESSIVVKASNSEEG